MPGNDDFVAFVCRKVQNLELINCLIGHFENEQEDRTKL